MDAGELTELTEFLTRVAEIARDDPTTAQQVREAVTRSGLLEVYGTGGALDVLDLLDAGGEAAVRTRLKELALADLREIIKTHQYDPEKATARWRSAAKLIDFIITHASEQLAEEQAAAEAAPGVLVPSWML